MVVILPFAMLALDLVVECLGVSFERSASRRDAA